VRWSVRPPDECWRRWCSSPRPCCAWTESADLLAPRKGALRPTPALSRLRPRRRRAGARRTKPAVRRAQRARHPTQHADFAETRASIHDPFRRDQASTLRATENGHRFEHFVIDAGPAALRMATVAILN